jgi:hypothetical protein
MFAGMPDRESDFFVTNTLVKTESEDQWHPLNSSDGRQIVNQWRSWRGPQGQTPAISVP